MDLGCEEFEKLLEEKAIDPICPLSFLRSLVHSHGWKRSKPIVDQFRLKNPVIPHPHFEPYHPAPPLDPARNLPRRRVCRRRIGSLPIGFKRALHHKCRRFSFQAISVSQQERP